MSTAGRRGNFEGSNPRQRADGRWQVHLRFTDELGVARRTTVYGKTPRDARAKASEVRTRVAAHLPARDKRVTVGAFTEEWVGAALAASDRKATTKALYSGLARKHIINSTVGSRSLHKLRPMHVEAWVVELRGRGLSESTVRSTYTVLRAILDTAVRDGALAVNPAAAVKRL